MKYFWTKFKSNSIFLPAYLCLQFMATIGIVTCGYNLNLFKEISYSHDLLWLIPIGFLFGIKLPTLMHNAAHENLKEGNIIIGELSALVTLISFGIVCINHKFHHAFADTDKDPHRPEGKSFGTYVLTCLHSGVAIIRRGYYKYHGESFTNRMLYQFCVVMHFSLIPLKLMAWHSILGTTFFALFYLPSFLSFIFTFAHVNYITHSVDERGKSVVSNMNSNIWYQFVNFLADGIYFHKNHHINPNLYNPMDLEESKPTFVTGAFQRTSEKVFAFLTRHEL
ncbi:MAG: fatty acid desaturase [Bdellovibrionota bacterium]|nr:fatty acid desaturase [Bdellovibrionota bacterium]